MDSGRLDAVLAPYNPWWKTSDWDATLPDYHRPIVGEVLSDLKDLPQIYLNNRPSACRQEHGAASCDQPPYS